jgi:phosphomevalonate kinase
MNQTSSLSSIIERVFDRNVIIGFSGKKQAGKDTAADLLARRYQMEKISFALPIKEAAREIFQFTDEQLYGDKKAGVDSFWDVTPRWALQTIGTDLFRKQVDRNIWIKSILRRISVSEPTRWVISDVRFPNEVRAIQEAGGFVVRIKRQGVTPRLSWWKKRAAQFFPSLSRLFGPEYHPSETLLDDFEGFDFVIENDGTLGDFRKKVDSVVAQLKDERYLARPNPKNSRNSFQKHA